MFVSWKQNFKKSTYDTKRGRYRNRVSGYLPSFRKRSMRDRKTEMSQQNFHWTKKFRKK